MGPKVVAHDENPREINTVEVYWRIGS